MVVFLHQYLPFYSLFNPHHYIHLFSMGNTPSSAVQKCLEGALTGNKDLYALPGTPFFQLSHVKPYNLGIAVTPAAVTYPETTEQIAQIVKCAVENKLKVQPRCGGHSYANYGQCDMQLNTARTNMDRHWWTGQHDCSRHEALSAILHERPDLAGHNRRRHSP